MTSTTTTAEAMGTEASVPGAGTRRSGSRVSPGPRRRRSAAARRNAWAGFLFCLPVLVLFLVFRYVPIVGATALSFSQFRMNGGTTFVGTENYQRLVTDPQFWHSLSVTGIFALVNVPLTIVVALAGAMLLNAIVRWTGAFRAMLFLPYVTSAVVAGIVWKWIYDTGGPINRLLSLVDLPTVGFLSGSQFVVLASIAVVGVWKSFGYSMLIFLAGLKSQSAEVHEAARIDGANGAARFRYITLPMLRPVMFFVLVIESVGAVQVFDVVYVMTGGGPARASTTVIFYLYEQGFSFFDFGYAATVGVAVTIVVLVLALVQRLFFREERAA